MKFFVLNRKECEIKVELLVISEFLNPTERPATCIEKAKLPVIYLAVSSKMNICELLEKLKWPDI